MYDYFVTVGDYLLAKADRFKLSQNCIALICNSFADYKFQHQSLFALISKFVNIDKKPGAIDFYHITMALRKFGIYSSTAIRWIIDTCTTDYLNSLSPQGLINVLCYLMAYNFYRLPMGFTLTHYLAITVGQLLPDTRDPELISQYKISSLIYHTITPQLLDCWLQNEVGDRVSAEWIRRKASALLYKSLLINSISGSHVNHSADHVERPDRSGQAYCAKHPVSYMGPSNFAVDVANVLENIGHTVMLEHNQDPYFIDILITQQ